jgi:carbonic anhydrase/acetyltransferase-like protein (isoleucine patch superfamily)
VQIKNHCFISSHVVISGFTIIENNCFIGVNSTFRDGITIAPFTLIGAGATIMSSTKEKAVYLAPKPFEMDKLSTELKIS